MCPDNGRTQIVENFSSEKNSFILECLQNFSQKFFFSKNFKSKKNQKRMKFLGAIILELVRGSLYTDENLYHEDKADGMHGKIPDEDFKGTVIFFGINYTVLTIISEAIRRIYAETTQHQVYGYDIPPDKLSLDELE